MLLSYSLKRDAVITFPIRKGEIAQNIPLNEDGDCLLHIVCQWGDVDIVRYLVTDERCNPNLVFKVSTTEKTPLHIAAKYEQDATLFKCCHVRNVIQILRTRKVIFLYILLLNMGKTTQ